MSSDAPAFALPPLPPLRNVKVFGRQVRHYDVGSDAGAAPLPVDLAMSTRAQLRTAFERMFFDKSSVTDALVDLAYAVRLERGDAPTIRSVLETLNDPAEKLDDRLAALRAPVLPPWGEQDAIAPLAMTHAWRRMIAGARLEVIADCGHLPPLERPAEFVRAVLSFLRP